ncbi:MAG TPA: S8 family peptidase, partial [Candidatus Kapabacteria bacterium]|nr:S8 family peptidase [Candidatus Kapabacteria bacterium]
MDATRFKHRHIILSDTSTKEKFTNPRFGKPDFRLPLRNREEHYKLLLEQLDKASKDFEQLKKQRKEAGISQKLGMTLTFRGEPGFDLKLESLESSRAGIELLSVHENEREKTVDASVFIPDGKLKYFIKKVEKYSSEENPKGSPKNQPLVESISKICPATLDFLWTDTEELLPQEGVSIWWEVWVRKEKGKDKGIDFFRAKAGEIGLKLRSEEIHFPDRAVLLAYGSFEQMVRSSELLDCISELRKAKDNPEFFMQMPVTEQREWVKEALERIEPSSSDRIAICILDTGITRMHPLIEPHLSENDMHAYNIKWIKADHEGHGTGMAGLALYGDLVDFLTSNNKISIPYRLESAKILPPVGQNDPELYGAIISQCISKVEIEAPGRKRIISMAITAPDNRDSGQPSSWSAKIDSICSGAEDDTRRLIILSAGNTNIEERHNYPDSNMTEGIQDPAQAWNALCVGAYTEKVFFDSNKYPGWQPIAPSGDLSPSSTTSIIWNNKWPIKPDIVFEGGNNAIAPTIGKADSFPESLQLLTTYFQPSNRIFTTFLDTSAATSQVARMAAIIQAEYPELWPET